MTGIAGIFSTGPARIGQLAQMIEGLKFRQHDCVSTFTEGSFGLAACNFYTTAESLETEHPLRNEDGNVAVVLDGFLTNWEELRTELTARRVILRDRSDAELVLRAYEVWGKACAQHLEGEFAFIVADLRAQQMYCARDHAGLKPLFYYRDRDNLFIASDIAAIIAALEKKPAPNLEFLAGLIAGSVFSDGPTAWAGLVSLPGAHWLAGDREKLRSERYYTLPTDVTIRYRSDQEYTEHYRSVLFDSVRRCSRSHLPLAIDVSGGLDSSAIFAAADDLQKNGQLLSPGIAGYHLLGAEGSRAYEAQYARAVADHLGRPVTEVPMFRPDRAWYEAQTRKDAHPPPATNGVMGIYVQQQAFANGSRVILSGHGGDEFLKGSTAYYREFASHGDVNGYLQRLREDIAILGIRKVLPMALRFGLAGVLPAKLSRLIRERGKQSYSTWLTKDPVWLNPAWRDLLLESARRHQASLPSDPDARIRLERFSYPFTRYIFSIIPRQYAANGLQLRLPMWSRQFVEFSAATPESARMRGGVQKYTHREAMRGLLPDLVVARPTKASFVEPEALRAFGNYVTGEGIQVLAGFIDNERLIDSFRFDEAEEVDRTLFWHISGTYSAACFLNFATKPTLFKGSFA